jgi:predicted MFS family arabinose efflux permease
MTERNARARAQLAPRPGGGDDRAQRGRQPPAYKDRTYLRYATGQAVSVLGDQVWYVALSWAAIRLASPGVASVVLAASAFPRIALLLFGGAIVDRYGPRRLMIGSDAARTVVALLAALVALRAPGIPLLLVVALLFGIADAVFLPAAGAMAPRLLSPDQLTSGAAVTTVTARAALTLGAPLGGVLVAVGGLPLACVVDAGTFVVSVAALLSVHPRPVDADEHGREPIGRAIRGGLGYLVRHPVLRLLLLISLLTNLGFVGPMNAGLAIVADARHWGAVGIGDMLAGFGLGAVVGALVTMRVRLGSARLLLALTIGIEGTAVGSIALVPVLWAAVALTTIAGLCSGPMAVLLTAWTQRLVDDRYRGRVASVNTLANLGLTPAAMVAMGVAAGQFGTVPAFLGSGALELTAAVLSLSPALRSTVDSATEPRSRVPGSTQPRSTVPR